MTGYKNYTGISTGNINILIIVPHDGNILPDDIPDRNDGSMPIDTNTRRLADGIRAELERLFFNKGINAQPFIIYNNLHRYNISEIIEN